MNEFFLFVSLRKNQWDWELLSRPIVG